MARHQKDKFKRKPQKNFRPSSQKVKTSQQDGTATRKDIARWLQQSAALQTSVKSAGDFALDPWQQRAFDALRAGHSVIVDAPTTAGKTRVVEAYFNAELDKSSFRAAYTTPVKSLSNDKVREFRDLFGREHVGIATGDIKDNLHAPVIVTTLETYRNSLLGVEPDLNRSIVVFDEYHFMQDQSRGSAWEEAIILTPENCQLLLLSASVANPEEFKTWLEKIHRRPCTVISEEHRPVPLVNLVYTNNQWVSTEYLPKHVLQAKNKGQLPFPLHLREAARVAATVLDVELTPCILYAGRRKACEGLIRELAKVLEKIPLEQREKIAEHLSREDQETKALSLMPGHLRQLIQAYGIAYHHSGLAPSVRVAIESLLKKGLLRYCGATMGLSIGINFSVRSAFISDFTRPSEGGRVKYPSSEVLQMLGRAGRRGRDAVGFSLWPSLESFQTLGNARRERCESRLKNDPTTLLGLIAQGRDAKDIETFYSKSFLRQNDSGVDLSLIRSQRLKSKLNTKDIPCTSPAHAFTSARYFQNKNAPCTSCPYQEPCHRYIQSKALNDLAALQLHLYEIEALDAHDQLTPYGEIAKYFPQAGGLVVARFIADHAYNQSTMLECVELMAAVSVARFKSPTVPERYRFPFDAAELERTLEEYYPIELFAELYDEPYGKRQDSVIRDFNPKVGYLVRAWLEGMPWRELEQHVTNDKFGSGDLMAVFYRTATYLQSLANSKTSDLAEHAASVRNDLLREPLSITL